MTIHTVSSLRVTRRRLAKRVGRIERADRVLNEMRAPARHCTCSTRNRGRAGRCQPATSFLCTAAQFERLHRPGHLRRVHVRPGGALQDMHDANYTGEKAGQSQVHAWFVIDRGYCGPAMINPVSIYKPCRHFWCDCRIGNQRMLRNYNKIVAQ